MFLFYDKIVLSSTIYKLLLAHLMGQYCFARCCLTASSVSDVVVCNVAGVRAGQWPGALATGRVGGPATDTARWVSAVTSS